MTAERFGIWFISVAAILGILFGVGARILNAQLVSSEEYPITWQLVEAAKRLGMDIPEPEHQGFLFQAQVINELSKRIVALEKK